MIVCVNHEQICISVMKVKSKSSGADTGRWDLLTTSYRAIGREYTPDSKSIADNKPDSIRYRGEVAPRNAATQLPIAGKRGT